MKYGMLSVTIIPTGKFLFSCVHGYDFLEGTFFGGSNSVTSNSVSFFAILGRIFWWVLLSLITFHTAWDRSYTGTWAKIYRALNWILISKFHVFIDNSHNSRPFFPLRGVACKTRRGVVRRLILCTSRSQWSSRGSVFVCAWVWFSGGNIFVGGLLG